jgi:hypothetical protein
VGSDEIGKPSMKKKDKTSVTKRRQYGKKEAFGAFYFFRDNRQKREE